LGLFLSRVARSETRKKGLGPILSRASQFNVPRPKGKGWYCFPPVNVRDQKYRFETDSLKSSQLMSEAKRKGLGLKPVVIGTKRKGLVLISPE
jgi:hypothetical protein